MHNSQFIVQNFSELNEKLYISTLAVALQSKGLGEVFRWYFGGMRKMYNFTSVDGYAACCLIVHILCVAGINHSYRVTFNSVGIVPSVSICHVIAVPSADGGTTPRQ